MAIVIKGGHSDNTFRWLLWSKVMAFMKERLDGRYEYNFLFRQGGHYNRCPLCLDLFLNINNRYMEQEHFPLPLFTWLGKHFFVGMTGEQKIKKQLHPHFL